MDIGTGKDLDKYEVDGNQIPYHLIDIHLPGYLYNIAEFQADFATVFESIHQKSKFPILCGGSGLYIETALRGHSFLGIPSDAIRRQQLETLTSNEIDEWYQKLPTSLTDKLNAKTDKRKIRAIIIDEYLKQHPDWKPRSLPDVKPLIVGVDIDRDLRRDKITKRLKFRLAHGMIEEVELLLSEHGLSYEQLDYYGLEYKWVGLYLQGGIDRDMLFERLNIAIHQFAKRQMTWFRKMEKDGFDIHWIDASKPNPIKVARVLELLHA
jgi:tRNA dimethylallyltransferase